MLWRAFTAFQNASGMIRSSGRSTVRCSDAGRGTGRPSQVARAVGDLLHAKRERSPAADKRIARSDAVDHASLGRFDDDIPEELWEKPSPRWWYRALEQGRLERAVPLRLR